RLVQALARRREPSLPVAKRLALLDLVLAAGVALRAGLRELGLDSLAGFRDEADLGLDPGHVGVGAVELALRGRESVARGVMIGARKLELAFALAQASRLGFELDPDALDIARVALRLGVRLVAPQEPEQILLLRAVGRKLVVAPRDLGLLPEPFDRRAELLADVAHAREVLAGVGEPVLGLAPALLVLRDPGGLLEEHAQLLGPRLDDSRDHALLDDRVGARAQPGPQEYVLHVAAPDVGIVDVVRRLAVALQDPLDRDLGVLRPLSRRPPQAVVEEELDARARDRLA